ncbi:MAG TPA: acylneuraminate cytidylyltransferase family protein [Actinobacteria bacterium]|nr:acylneuraminate cytidylyltransferase family protein [Actinomycetota bacterium]
MLVDAFVPLKGHSERVPGKNLRDFWGRPLFEVIVETLQQAASVRRIFIDTDDDEIAARAARLDDVTVMRRRPELVGDDVSVNLLIRACLEAHEDIEHLLQTHATNPLLRPETIDAAVERYEEDPSIDSLFGVTRYQARFYTAELEPINHDPTELIPTQRLAPLFMENSALYLFSRSAFFERGHRITARTAMFEIDPAEAVDIDEERDFRLALALAKAGGR